MNAPPVRNLVFWEPSYSPHKVAFFNALALKLNSVDIKVTADQDISPERRAQGWAINAGPSVPWSISPSELSIKQLVYENPKDTLHIFSGIRWVPSLVSAIEHVKKANARFAIMSEPRVREGWRGELRYLHSWMTEGWFRRNAEFILAIGRNGPAWFQSVGYPHRKVFPFAYFVDPPSRVPVRGGTVQTTDEVHIGFVGRIIEMKGIYDVVRAAGILGKKARLTMVGVGSDEPKMKALCDDLHIKVNHVGALPIDEIGGVMVQFDVLVLASHSKDDGWGVVISEALMAGTAVIATPQVGASLTLDEGLFGKCVAAQRPHAIAKAVEQLKSEGAFLPEQRDLRAKLAQRRLSASAGAEYLSEILAWTIQGGVCPLPFYCYKLSSL